MIYVDHIDVCPRRVYVTEGKTNRELRAEASPINATCREIRWISDDPEIAEINEQTGYITGKKVGTVQVYAQATDGSGEKERVTVVVEEEADISLDEYYTIVYVDQSITLTADVIPARIAREGVRWDITDTSVVDIKTFGNTIKITAKKAGNAVVVATAVGNSSCSACCQLDIREYVGDEPITMTSPSITMVIGDVRQMATQAWPSGMVNRNIQWESSNSDVAEVDATGKVIAKSIGTAKISAKTQDDSFTYIYKISVINGIVVEKYPDVDHSRIVFPDGKVWNCINFDIIDDYTLNKDEPESQRFFDNAYERKVIDEATGLTYYYEPMKEYSDEELKIIYMIDPHGMAAYVREYAQHLPGSDDGVQARLRKIIGYKDRIFAMLFDREPYYYQRESDSQWVITSYRGDLTEVLSESEFLFGTHPIYDHVTARAFLNLVIDLISAVTPALSKIKYVGKAIECFETYLSLSRSVSNAVLAEDFNGFVTEIVNGVVEEDWLNDTIVVAGKNFKAANYTLGWASTMLSLSSSFEALANTFNDGPHFYKEVFTQCADDTSYDVYMRMADNNLVSIENIRNIID